MVAVRSMGLALESIVGFNHGERPICMVSQENLESLVDKANERFKENSQRIARFQGLLTKPKGELSERRRRGQEGERWEDPRVRRDRKRAEGLMRSLQMKGNKALEELDYAEIVDSQLLNQNT